MGTIPVRVLASKAVYQHMLSFSSTDVGDDRVLLYSSHSLVILTSETSVVNQKY